VSAKQSVFVRAGSDFVTIVELASHAGTKATMRYIHASGLSKHKA
jgi:hypothetical protein